MKTIVYAKALICREVEVRDDADEFDQKLAATTQAVFDHQQGDLSKWDFCLIEGENAFQVLSVEEK